MTSLARLGLVALALAALAGPAPADDGHDLVDVMSGLCATSLESRAAIGPGLTRADPAMEQRLLNGKKARLWRTWNPKIVVVAHDSGDTCEVMGLGITISDFARAFFGWVPASCYSVDAQAAMPDDGPGGAYLARAMPEGDFIQGFIQTMPQATFVGITLSRTANSEQARELLGMQ